MEESMKVSEIIKVMSPAAVLAVEAAPDSNPGTVVSNVTFGVMAELSNLGVVGPRGGLTIKGSAVAQILKERRMDRLFG